MKKITLRISDQLYEKMTKEAQDNKEPLAVVLRRHLKDAGDGVVTLWTSTGPREAPKELMEELMKTCGASRKISFIKTLRDRCPTFLGLREAKEMVESYLEMQKS